MECRTWAEIRAEVVAPADQQAVAEAAEQMRNETRAYRPAEARKVQEPTRRAVDDALRAGRPPPPQPADGEVAYGN